MKSSDLRHISKRKGFVILFVIDVLVPSLTTRLGDPFMLIIIGIPQELSLIIIDNTRLRVVEAISAVIAIGRHNSWRYIISELRPSCRLQPITDFSVESPVIAITILPVLLGIFQAIWEYIFTLQINQIRIKRPLIFL